LLFSDLCIAVLPLIKAPALSQPLHTLRKIKQDSTSILRGSESSCTVATGKSEKRKQKAKSKFFLIE
jgi:hypothetical protein